VKLVHILVLALAVVSNASAGEFQPRLVSAEASWVLHVDLEAVGRSNFLGALHEQGQIFENEFDLDLVLTDFGVDPLRELRSLTIYAPDPKIDGVATVVIGAASLDAAWTRMQGQGVALPVAGREGRRVTAGRSTRYVVMYGASDAETRMAIVATAVAAMERALAVLDGTAAHMASEKQAAQKQAAGSQVSESPARITARPRSGSMVFAASAPGTDPQKCALFLQTGLQYFGQIADLAPTVLRDCAHNARGLEFDFGESRGEIAARMALEFETPKQADELERALISSVDKLRAGNATNDVARRLRDLVAPLHVNSPLNRVLVSYVYGATTFAADVAIVASAGQSR
jgi:hypothetical protein